MTPDQARPYVEVLDLYAGEFETLVEETRADKPGLTSALNPHLHDMARGVAIVREKITADAENMTRMIAGMHEEWGVTYTGVNHGGRHTEWGYETRDEAERQARRYRLCPDMHPIVVVRRYVTEPEEA